MKPSISDEPKVFERKNGQIPKVKAAFRQAASASFPSKEDSLQRQLQQLLSTVKAYRRGDFSVRCSVQGGIIGEISEALNETIELNEAKAEEFARVATSLVSEGRMTERASLGPMRGGWATSTES